jgi:hypothetical protein
MKNNDAYRKSDKVILSWTGYSGLNLGLVSSISTGIWSNLARYSVSLHLYLPVYMLSTSFHFSQRRLQWIKLNLDQQPSQSPMFQSYAHELVIHKHIVQRNVFWHTRKEFVADVEWIDHDQIHWQVTSSWADSNASKYNHRFSSQIRANAIWVLSYLVFVKRFGSTVWEVRRDGSSGRFPVSTVQITADFVSQFPCQLSNLCHVSSG